MKLGIIFGGVSSEHHVSIVSATSILENLDKDKYDIYPIYISKAGDFYKYNKNINEIKMLKITDELDNLEKIDNIIDYLKKMDILFPVLHGKNGEDGTIQGMLEMLGKKYVGSRVLSSSICMDKAYTKTILEMANIEQAKSICLKKDNDNYIYIDKHFNRKILTKDEINEKVINDLCYPVFIKPSKSGSSIGVNKAKNNIELFRYIEEAFKYDSKVLIEEEIVGQEVECAILGNDKPVASSIGEILEEDIYSFDAKYNTLVTNTLIPANIDDDVAENIKKIAIKAYLACDCTGLSRVDFFVQKDTNKIILNEINTMPGFTEISMYPKLMKHYGYSYKELLDKLIEYAK